MAFATINEYDFAGFLCCPLRAASGRESPLLHAADEVLRWMLLEVFNEREPQILLVRRKLETAGMPVTDVVRSARRLQELWYTRPIIQPITPYELHFGRNAVKGNYAVLSEPKARREPLIVRLRHDMSAARAESRGPDAISLCRWLHFRMNEPAMPMVRVLNWALDRDEHWMEFYDERVARQYMEAASKIHAGNLLFPSPGVHCNSCSQPNCFAARDEYSTWMR